MEQNFFPTRTPQAGMMALVDPAAVAAAEAAKARIQSAFIMAYQKPRDEMQARDRILTACKRTEFAGKAEYSKPVGNTKITGPSIRFAELALREWGNIMSEVQTLYDDDNIRRCRVSIVDLETNAQFNKDIQLRKTIERKSKKGREHDVIGERKNTYGEMVYILRATDEEMYTKEAAWVSKVLRNEGLRLIPTDIIEEGIQAARATLAKSAYQDPAGEKKKIVDAFSGIGIKPRELEKYLQHSLDTISPQEIVGLRTVYQSIKDGEASWNDYTTEKKDDEQPPDPDQGLAKAFNDATANQPRIDDFLRLIAKDMSPDQAKAEVMRKPGEIHKLLSAYQKWISQQQPKSGQQVMDEAVKDGELKGNKGLVHTGPENMGEINIPKSQVAAAQKAMERIEAQRQETAGPDTSENDDTPDDWDPLMATPQDRYHGKKREAIQRAAKEVGCDISGLKPKEAHEMVKAVAVKRIDLLNTFNELWATSAKEAKDYAGEESGCELTINGYARPDKKQMAQWVASCQEFIKQNTY